ncbi:MAG TPA: hypothetical protein VGH28_17675 [Polyangiaceae bacterium]|jgi:hypothetical protein
MKTKILVTLGVATLALAALAPLAAAQDNDYPPPEVIVTMSPVYYEGHAAYWWHNHWHYRDAHGHWGHYNAEPKFLHDHRYGHPADRHYYAGGYHRR